MIFFVFACLIGYNIEIDANGELITGYIFTDNYFELYVNGTPVGKDAIPFTQFNSHIVRFRLSTPYTLAIKLVDREENLGLGAESNQGSSFHPGDDAEFIWSTNLILDNEVIVRYTVQ